MLRRQPVQRITLVVSIAVFWLVEAKGAVLKYPLTYSTTDEDDEWKRGELGSPASAETPCDGIVAQWTATEARGYIHDTIDANVEDIWTSLAIKFMLALKTFNGVKVMKICAKCSDYSPSLPAEAAVYNTFCSATNYGNDAVNSGLVMVPTKADGTLLEGTLVGSNYLHGTATKRVPTTIFTAAHERDLEIALNVATTATGKISILPDYLGYGQSSAMVHKGYLVKKQYQTATIPLWKVTQAKIQEQSNCATALADATALTGFSEGGYAAIAVADALSRMGVDIVRVQAGGGPYKMGSVAILTVFDSEHRGVFPDLYIYYFAILGATFSSTYEDLANYGQDQDLFAPEHRTEFVDMIYNSLSAGVIRERILQVGPLNLFDDQLVQFALNRTAENDYDPCHSNHVIPGFNDKLCEAFGSNDLTQILEEAQYHIALCHSPDDEIVSIRNLPNFAANPFLMRIDSSGSHEESAYTCLIEAMEYLLGDGPLNANYDDKHVTTGCPPG